MIRAMNFCSKIVSCKREIGSTASRKYFIDESYWWVEMTEGRKE